MLREPIACSHLRNPSIAPAVEVAASEGTPRERLPIKSAKFAACDDKWALIHIYAGYYWWSMRVPQQVDASERDQPRFRKECICKSMEISHMTCFVSRSIRIKWLMSSSWRQLGCILDLFPRCSATCLSRKDINLYNSGSATLKTACQP